MAVGSWLHANPAIGKEILNGGHDLGNHTYNHKAMLHLNLKEAQSEIEKGKAAIKASVGSSQKFFRPSGTPKSNSIIRKAAISAGYTNCITYDVDTLDYQDPKAAAIISNCMKTVKNGSIISLHLGHKNTVTALPKLISELKSAGLAPVTLSKLLA
jgi:peptidoglycan/xylan/chitin deacetylase (PgdA/CDA1 family)